MSHATRASANATMDAALATIISTLPAWVAAGGNRNNLIRSVLGAFCNTDQGMALFLHRRLGSSFLIGQAATITAGDTAA